DLATFALEIVLNHRVAAEHLRKFEFVERGHDGPLEEPGLREFLQDPSLSGTATGEELEFLKKLRFKGKRPTALYYYRELQSLREIQWHEHHPRGRRGRHHQSLRHPRQARVIEKRENYDRKGTAVRRGRSREAQEGRGRARRSREGDARPQGPKRGPRQEVWVP